MVDSSGIDDYARLERPGNQQTVRTAAGRPNLGVPRRELDPVYAYLKTLRGHGEHPLLVALTGPFGSGTSTALHQIQQAARAQGTTSVLLDFTTTGFDWSLERSSLIHLALQKIAQGLQMPRSLPDMAREAGLIGTQSNIKWAQAISDFLSSKADQDVLLLFDHPTLDSDVTEPGYASRRKAARGLMLDLDEILFPRLNDNRGVMIVVAARIELPWQVLPHDLESVPLRQFTAEQTMLQLACSYSEATALLTVTGGLPAANALNWEWIAPATPSIDSELRVRLVGTAAPDMAVDELYARFVQPFLSTDQRLNDTITATALLDKGFDINEFIATVQHVSYLQGQYTAQDKPYYFRVVERMYGLGLVSYRESDGRYYMDDHLRHLLTAWSAKHHSPEGCTRDRALIPDIYAGTIGSTESPVPLPSLISQPIAVQWPAPPSAETAPHITGEERQGLDGIYDRMSKVRSSDRFVGRQNVLQEIAAHMCRQANHSADIVFLRGGAGKGKTALLSRFLTIAREAVASSHELLVPQLRDQREDDRGKNVIDVDEQVLDVGQEYRSPSKGLIDLEFSPSNRLGSVRRAIIRSIIDTLVAEDHEHLPSLSAEDDAALPIALEKYYFGAYVDADHRWHDYRNDIREYGRSSRGRKTLAREYRTKLRTAQEELERHFLAGCQKVAHQPHKVETTSLTVSAGARSGRSRRILLVFDTYDFPVRSGLSATLFISQIAAQLAGDYFILIACRPPIWVEEQDPYIGGDLTAYLPDDLRDQAKVIDLDADIYRLKKTDIQKYYENQNWYAQAVRERTNFSFAGAPIGPLDVLVDQMAEIVDKHGGLPVLLSLVEFYVGMANQRMPEYLANDPFGLSVLDADAFERVMVEGLLRNVPGAQQQRLSQPRQWALLLMTVIDRGLSWQLLNGISDTLSTIRNYPGVMEIWAAVLDIVQADQQAYMNPNEEGNTPPVTGTLVKVVPSTLHKTAYKLHDYISTLFNHYMGWRLADLSSVEDEEPFALILKREPLIRAVIEYMDGLARLHVPHASARVESATEQRRLRVYQAARSNLVYYGLRLAAIQLDDELAGRRSFEALGDRVLLCPPDSTTGECQECADLQAPQQLIAFDSTLLIRCLRETAQPKLAVNAGTTAKLVLSYLYAKVLREVSEYVEYGFAEMLLQEVRHYLYDQSAGDTRLANLTLPIVNDRADGQRAFRASRRLYYAGLLTWEWASEEYPTADPWLEEQLSGLAHLRRWRHSADWADIVHLLLLDEPSHHRSEQLYQDLYARWMQRQGYARRTHDAFSLLANETDGVEYVDVLIQKARAALVNPVDVCYRDRDGHLSFEKRGLRAAQLYLREALLVSKQQDLPPRILATVHHHLADVEFLLDHLSWQLNPSTAAVEPPEFAWGAPVHYYEALQLLARHLTRVPERSGTVPRAHEIGEAVLQYAMALNGYSFILAGDGEARAAEVACNQGIEILNQLGRRLLDLPPESGEPLYRINQLGGPKVDDPAIQELFRQVCNALGKAYSTRGEFWQFKYPGVDLAQPPVGCTAEDLAMTMQVNYDPCDRLFEPGNREWRARIETQRSELLFWRAVLLHKIPSQAEEGLAAMLAAAHQMQYGMNFLFAKDRPDGYNRLARMYIYLSGVADLDPVQAEAVDAELAALKEPWQAFARALPRGSYACQAFIYVEQGFASAQAIDDPLYQLNLSRYGVEILAQYATNLETAEEYYQHRFRHLESGDSEQLTYRQRVMLGIVHLALGLAYLKQAEESHSNHVRPNTSRDGRRNVKRALDHLNRGFDIPRPRGTEDQQLLLNRVREIATYLRLFEIHDLQGLYSNLKRFDLNRELHESLEEISVHFIQQLPPIAEYRS